MLVTKTTAKNVRVCQGGPWSPVLFYCHCPALSAPPPLNPTPHPAPQEYLLRDSELTGRPGALRFIERENPNSDKYSKMKLYLLAQVQEKSYERYGGADGLDKEHQRRDEVQQDQKLKRHAKKMAKVGRKAEGGGAAGRGCAPLCLTFSTPSGPTPDAETDADEHVAGEKDGARARVPARRRGTHTALLGGLVFFALALGVAVTPALFLLGVQRGRGRVHQDVRDLRVSVHLREDVDEGARIHAAASQARPVRS